MYDTLGFLMLLATQSVGYRDTGAYGKTNEQVDNQIDQRTCGADCCHRKAAPIAAYNYQVCSVKQQLQQTGQNDGNGVGNDAGEQRPVQHALIKPTHPLLNITSQISLWKMSDRFTEQ